MNAKEKEAIHQLHSVCIEAIEFVGSANYSHRERAARTAVNNAFTAFANGRLDEVKQDIDAIWDEQNE